MCVIVYKSKKTNFPAKETLETCFQNNPDGAGYMFVKNGKVHIRKGFMTFESFWQSLTCNYDVKSPYVFHFRISTQAGIRKDCTHPFPLSKNLDELRKLKTTTDFGIAHNGIIWLTNEYSGKKSKVDYNDTMTFITDYLSLIIHDMHFYKNRDTVNLIEKLADSKLAILDSTGHCELIGKFIQDNGIYYSNDSYLERTWKSYYNADGTYNFSHLDSWTKYDKVYDEPYLGKSKDDYEVYWTNEDVINSLGEDGLYHFNDFDCPATIDENYQYCNYCVNYKNCYGEVVKKSS